MMRNESVNPEPRRILVARCCGGAAVAVGLLVLFGWYADIAILKSVLPALPTMKVNAALSFVFAGVSLLLVERGGRGESGLRALARGCAVIVAAMGMATLAQYALDVDLGIDQWLMREAAGSVATSSPNRMAQMTAFLFVLIGMSLFLHHTGRASWLALALTASSLFFSTLAVLGYLYGVYAVQSAAPFSSIAMHTAAMLLMVSVGLLAAAPELWLGRLLMSDGVDGMLLRRLLPASILGSVLIGWMRQMGEQAGWYDQDLGVAIHATAQITVFGAIVVGTAAITRRSETQRRQSEGALQDSERLFRAVVEASPFGLVLVNPAGRIVLANTPMARLFGYDPRELPDLPIEQLIPERHRHSHADSRSEYHQDPVPRLMGSGRDLWGLRKDGSELPVEIGLRPVETGHGVCVLASVIDITLRKQAELALRESERRYRLLLEGVPQLVWTCLPDGRCDYLSRQWVEYTGVPAPEHLGYGWLGAVHPEDRDDLTERWEHAVTTREPLDVEFRLRSAAGEYRWFKTRAVLFHQDDGGEKWFGTNTDIHDRKIAEAELRELNATLEQRVEERTRALQASEERFRAIFHAQFQFIGIMSPSGVVLEANRTALLASGVSTESVLGKPFWETAWWSHDGAQQARLQDAVRRAAAGEQIRFEASHPTPEGGLIWVDFSLTPFRDEQGKVVLLIPEGRDITERKRAEKALREQEERFRSAFDYAPIGIALVAPSGRWLRVNRSLCELVGYTHQELLKIDFQTITHPDDLDADLRYVRQMLDGTILTYQMEKRYFHKRGHVVHVQPSVSLVRDSNNQPLYFISQIKDISQRKEAERALAANDALLRQFIEHSPAAIAMLDRELRYLQMSDRWLVDYHLVGRDILGLSHYEVFPDIPERWKAIHQRVLAGAVEKCDEDAFERANGSTEWLQWECRPWLNAAGEIGGIIMFTQVITQRRLAEEQVRASLREKEVLLKEIHHRVKNNLQIVSTLLDLQSDFTTDRAAMAMFQESRGRVKSMALIHERLYRSRDIARVDFAEYVRQLADELFQIYKVNDDEIELVLSVDVPPVPIDIAIPCGLLLNELMSNCFKHAFAGVAKGCVRVSLHRDMDQTNILVIGDDGVGFPAGADFRNTSSFGLQLVNTLVEQLHGEIELAADHGSTFTIRFPHTEI